MAKKSDEWRLVNENKLQSRREKKRREETKGWHQNERQVWRSEVKLKMKEWKRPNCKGRQFVDLAKKLDEIQLAANNISTKHCWGTKRGRQSNKSVIRSDKDFGVMLWTGNEGPKGQIWRMVGNQIRMKRKSVRARQGNRRASEKRRKWTTLCFSNVRIKNKFRRQLGIESQVDSMWLLFAQNIDLTVFYPRITSDRKVGERIRDAKMFRLFQRNFRFRRQIE